MMEKVMKEERKKLKGRMKEKVENPPTLLSLHSSSSHQDDLLKGKKVEG